VSFADHPTLKLGQKFAFTAYMLGSTVFVFACIILAFAPNSDVPAPPIWITLLLFPGSLILAIAGMTLLLRFFMRDKN